MSQRTPDSPLFEDNPLFDDSPRRYCRRRGSQLVVLNVYDISDNGAIQNLNNLCRMVGTGFFHVGVQVYATEWSFGFAENEQTGIYSCTPKEWFGRYRETVIIGRTFHSEIAVLELIEQMTEDWPGYSYDLLYRNCADFCSELCKELCGPGPLPVWVTNMAGVGAALSAGMEVVSSKVQTAAAIVGEGLDKLDTHRSLFSNHDSAYGDGMFSARSYGDGMFSARSAKTGGHLRSVEPGELDEAYGGLANEGSFTEIVFDALSEVAVTADSVTHRVTDSVANHVKDAASWVKPPKVQPPQAFFQAVTEMRVVSWIRHTFFQAPQAE